MENRDFSEEQITQAHEESFVERRNIPDEALIRKVVEIMSEHSGLNGAVSEEVHREHHAFIQAYIAERKRKEERWESIRRHVIGWSIIATIGAVVTALGSVVSNAVLNTLRGGHIK